jgi:hypothetical protein
VAIACGQAPPAGTITAIETRAYSSEADCEAAKREAAGKNASWASCLPSTIK